MKHTPVKQDSPAPGMHPPWRLPRKPERPFPKKAGSISKETGTAFPKEGREPQTPPLAACMAAPYGDKQHLP